uniref:Uncharacterized protein n=1 Tax=Globodera rostochiensis TaxID=31243 RepID=A0A914H8R4_GLORO
MENCSITGQGIQKGRQQIGKKNMTKALKKLKKYSSCTGNIDKNLDNGEEEKKNDQNIGSSSERDDLSLASWVKLSPSKTKTTLSSNFKPEKVSNRTSSIPADMFNLVYQWDHLFLTQSEAEWHCPEPNPESWCESIKFANKALQNYLKFISKWKDYSNSKEDEMLSMLALKPSFLAPGRNIVNAKITLIKAYRHYNDGDGSQTLPNTVETFENRENCAKTMKLAKAFEELHAKLQDNQKKKHFNKLKNADTINKFKKLRNVLNEVNIKMQKDDGYCFEDFVVFKKFCQANVDNIAYQMNWRPMMKVKLK